MCLTYHLARVNVDRRCFFTVSFAGGRNRQLTERCLDIIVVCFACPVKLVGEGIVGLSDQGLLTGERIGQLLSGS